MKAINGPRIKTVIRLVVDLQRIYDTHTPLPKPRWNDGQTDRYTSSNWF